MLKVFHIISQFDLGGAERVALNIASSDNANIEYHLVELIHSKGNFSKNFVDEIKSYDIQFHRFYIPSIKFHYVFERFAALIFPLWFFFIFRKHQPNVIHCHTEIPDLAVYYFFRLYPKLLKKCKIIRTIHNTKLWTGMERTGKKVEHFFKKNHANIAISKSVQQSYFNTYGENPRIIYNGIKETSQQQYPIIKSGTKNVLFAGRFEKQKGISTLIKIIKKLEHESTYYFYIFGAGSLENEINRELAGCRNVEINPPLFGISKYMKSFDYMIMPSEHEGLSIISIEASINGLPLIINNCPGLKDTLPKDWPLKVEDNNIEEYVNIFLHKLYEFSTEDLCTKSKAFVTNKFGIVQMQKNYENLYV